MNIKPCPFCGNTNIKEPRINTHISWVECDNCNAAGPIYEKKYNENLQIDIVKALTIDLWNNRYEN